MTKQHCKWLLGKFGEPYDIVLSVDAKLYALLTPRRVPYPLRKKVKQKLECMESIGIISRVNEPSQWCVRMVAVQKKKSGVRMCGFETS